MNWYSLRRLSERHAVLSIGNDIGAFGSDAGDLIGRLAGVEEITLRMDSNGGSLPIGLELHRALRGRARRAVVAGDCCSTAVPILLAADRRAARPAAHFLIHGPVDYVAGSPDYLRQRADALACAAGQLAAIIQERTGQTPETVAGWLSRDTWFTAEQALAAGLVHEIVTPDPEPAAEPGGADAQTGAAPPAPDPREELFYDFLRALTAAGPLRVRDRARFIREFGVWAAGNVRAVDFSV